MAVACFALIFATSRSCAAQDPSQPKGVRVEVNAMLGFERLKLWRVAAYVYTSCQVYVWMWFRWHDFSHQQYHAQAVQCFFVSCIAAQRMDLIEPDMDAHNGVIFLGLPTEVVHKVPIWSNLPAVQSIVFPWCPSNTTCCCFPRRVDPQVDFESPLSPVVPRGTEGYPTELGVRTYMRQCLGFG